MAAQRTSVEPCLVMLPRRTLTSDSRWRGVNPAQEHNASGLPKQDTSPISATIMAPMVCPTPGMAWMAQ